VEVNQQQIASFLRMLLSAGGPLAALILTKTGMTHEDYDMYVAVALAFIPPIGAAIWGWYDNRKIKQVTNIAQMPAIDQLQALNKVSDATKVRIAEAVPDVKTVVIDNAANGTLGAMAASPTHPNIVTESQNEKDTKLGQDLTKGKGP
jgi:hypothetical protein